jgi:DNA ligase-associated metallophosphoesterase
MNSTHEFELQGESLIADADAALIWPERELLAIADLHFEKGSAFGAMGTFLPPYDTRSTLDRLEMLLERYDPSTVLCLGDSFHDLSAGERMHKSDVARLSRFTCSRNWIWVAGNHDPTVPSWLGGQTVDEVHLGPLCFRHEAKHGPVKGEISGHYHPKARVKLRGRTLYCSCFATNGCRLLLPAFGAYTGGLNVLDQVLEPILGRDPIVFALRRGAIHAVGRRSLKVEPELRPKLL